MSSLLFATKAASFRELLLLYHTMVPFLYSDSHVAPTVEHVVPQRVLRECTGSKSRAIQDPYNLFLATKRINSVRSDYPFLLPTAGELSELRGAPSFAKDFRKVGKDSYVSHKKRLFIPRHQDYGIICRSVLHCSREYGVDCSAVVNGGENVVRKWAETPMNKKEQTHNILALYWNFSAQGIPFDQGGWRKL